MAETPKGPPLEGFIRMSPKDAALWQALYDKSEEPKMVSDFRPMRVQFTGNYRWTKERGLSISIMLHGVMEEKPTYLKMLVFTEEEWWEYKAKGEKALHTYGLPVETNHFTPEQWEALKKVGDDALAAYHAFQAQFPPTLIRKP